MAPFKVAMVVSTRAKLVLIEFFRVSMSPLSKAWTGLEKSPSANEAITALTSVRASPMTCIMRLKDSEVIAISSEPCTLTRCDKSKLLAIWFIEACKACKGP